MTPLLAYARFMHYGHYGHAARFGGGGVTHMVVSGLIHGAIYKAMAPFFRGLSPVAGILVAVGIIAGTSLVYRALSRA